MLKKPWTPALILITDARETRAMLVCEATLHSGSTRTKGYLFEQRFTSYLLAHHYVLRQDVPRRMYESKDIVAS
jgi:hypothetical protein